MMSCPERGPALHAYADGELDALGTAALEAHLRDCAGCRAELDDIEAVRTALRAPEARVRAPEALRMRIEALADVRPAAPPQRWNWPSFAGGGAIGALAASIALMLALPQLASPTLTGQLTDELPGELVASHVRSLQASHLVDIPTSDRHVVKPWFNGRIDFAPPVPELAPQGFPLVGGRLDVIGGRTVAAIVYKRRLHTINLFVRPAGGSSSQTALTRDSYSLVHWTANGLDFWAVSDVGAADLGEFEKSFRAASAKL
jgi:anti-sigma factor RsiW